jgi:hypothetical protein
MAGDRLWYCDIYLPPDLLGVAARYSYSVWLLGVATRRCYSVLLLGETQRVVHIELYTELFSPEDRKLACRDQYHKVMVNSS